MAIGGSVLLILAGVFVATGPGAHPGRFDVRYTGLAMAGIGLVVLCLGIVFRYKQTWRRERRRESYARARAARRSMPRPGPASATTKPPRRWYPRQPLRQYGSRVEPEEVPLQSLGSLGQVDSLVEHTRMPGQHGKLPPSPQGPLRYPC